MATQSVFFKLLEIGRYGGFKQVMRIEIPSDFQYATQGKMCDVRYGWHMQDIQGVCKKEQEVMMEVFYTTLMVLR